MRSRRPGGEVDSPNAFAPLEIVEADEHAADIIFAVGVDTPKGVRYVPSHRMTLIVVRGYRACAGTLTSVV